MEMDKKNVEDIMFALGLKASKYTATGRVMDVNGTRMTVRRIRTAQSIPLKAQSTLTEMQSHVQEMDGEQTLALVQIQVKPY